MGKNCLVRMYKGVKENSFFSEKLKYTGGNSGNIVWFEATKKMLDFDEELYISSDEIKELQSNYNEVTYILPLANHISSGGNSLDDAVDILLQNKNSSRVVVLGLGAQLTKEYNTPRKLMLALPQTRITALKKLSESGESIGIRGEITAECLDCIGISNYRVLGCPSFYSNRNAIADVCDSGRKKLDNLSINLSAYGEKGMGQFMNILEREGLFNKSIYIMQNIWDFPKTISENLEITERHMRERFPGTKVLATEFTKYVREKGYLFSSYEAWSKCFTEQNITYSIGPRFHGNMIALLSGIPSVWITHDSRTTELCKCMKLPSVPIEKVEDMKCIDDILAYQNYGSEFFENYIKLEEEFNLFLKENRIRKK